MLRARPALLGYAGRSIALGIRPEALDDSARRNGDGGTLRGIVRAIEALGPDNSRMSRWRPKPVLVEDVVEGLVDMAEADDLAEIRTG